MEFVSAWGENVGGHCWRTTGDITDTWNSMSGILDRQADLWPYARPGAWNDPDMLVLGPLGWGNIHPTRLTPNEQYTHMSFWCILCSPLLIGCDMTQIDDFTMSLLTNDEVLETSQDPLGAAAARVTQPGVHEVWAKPMSDGSIVLALYNKSSRDAVISADFAFIGLVGEVRAWRARCPRRLHVPPLRTHASRVPAIASQRQHRCKTIAVERDARPYRLVVLFLISVERGRSTLPFGGYSFRSREDARLTKRSAKSPTTIYQLPSTIYHLPTTIYFIRMTDTISRGWCQATS